MAIVTITVPPTELQEGDVILRCHFDPMYPQNGSSWARLVVGKRFNGTLYTKEYIVAGWGRYHFTVEREAHIYNANGEVMYHYVKGKGWVLG